MRVLTLAVIGTLALTLVAAQVGAVGKITVDPNVPGVQATKAEPEKDERLAQKVTYEAKRKTVSAILADLSGATGVKLRAGWNEKDWQVRDRKMNIFAKDLPLAQLMSSIARVMKFKWEIGQKDGVKTYRLFMDRKTLLDADAQKARNDERILKLKAEKRKKVIDEFKTADSISEQDLAVMKTDRPYMYMMASTGIAGGLGKLIKEVPYLAEALATGQELAISASQLSPDGQEGVRQMMLGFDKFLSILGDEPKTDLSTDFGAATLIVNEDPDTVNSPTLGCFNIRHNGRNNKMDIPNPDGNLARFFGLAFVYAEDGKRSIKDFSEAQLSEIREAASAGMEEFDPGEPLTEHPDDPSLLAKAKIETDSRLLVDIQSALAKSSGFAVVSDSFGKTECSGRVRKDEAEIKTLLDKIAKSSHYNWNKYKSVLEFRDRSWFKKRSDQIPESRIEAWRQAFVKNGTLNIAQLAQIADLTQEQIKVNIQGDEVLDDRQSGEFSIARNRDILRAYAALTQDERDRLFSPSGLSIRDLPPDRLAAMERSITGRNAGFLLNPDAAIVLCGECVQQGTQFKYTFTATTSNGLDPIVWSFTTPKYEPPKEAKPAG
ncbi:MAG: hypothetical protein M1133_10575 [Armatimonadetes bacterium]|nr:hypothetical protein [Armatimonadota bacterium]